MKIPVTWLREYVAARHAARGARRARSSLDRGGRGIERRGVPDADGNLGLFRVGRVLEAGKHPNADRLQLCRVDVGEREPRQIVCGAWNFGAGATVAVALPGAVLPDGLKLERAQAARRGLRRDDPLRARARARPRPHRDHGAPGRRAGHAARRRPPAGRDGARGGDRPTAPTCSPSTGSPARSPRSRRRAGAAAGRDPEQSATSRSTSGSTTSRGARATSAGCSATSRSARRRRWLRARLTAAGMRPISNVVDVTNYVMLALGNPLHAFDFAKLAEGRVVVRRARPGEELRTLDGELPQARTADLVIADAERADRARRDHGRRGDGGLRRDDERPARGGELRAGRDLRSSERLRLRTEGSNRWEKGVDPYLAEQAPCSRRS